MLARIVSAIEIMQTTGNEDLAHAINIRRRVFIGEQGVTEDEEIDGLDGQSRHYLVWLGDEAVATARVRSLDGGCAKIERMAVLASHRRRGIGARLMARIIDDARAEGMASAALNAQCRVEDFYRNLGFTPEGEVFMDSRIPHIRMVRTL